MQRKAPTPSHHWFFVGSNLQEATTSILQATTCKEAPTPIYFLQVTTYRRLLPQLATNDIYQATTWYGSTNFHLFSTGYNLQEAPTSASYNWHLLSYNLILKHQLPHTTMKTHADLPGYQLCYIPSSLLSSTLHICFYPWIFTSSMYAPSSSYSFLLISSLSQPFYAYAGNIIYRDHLITVFIPQGIRNEQVWLFAFPLLIFLSSTFRII